MKVSRAQLIEHVKRWASDPSHAQTPWIPKFAYHFTDIANAAEVLQTGELLSRNEAVRRGLMHNDNASPQVISRTPAAHSDYARLYFRPRTPTQFHNEGIRPPSERHFDGAHCPVPVFLVFDLVETLCLNGVLFSNGNMAASQVEFTDSATFFGSIPFDLVYHARPIESSLNNRQVVFHRHAEVLAPGALSLDTLSWVGCRTHAERESLLHLLGPARSKWERKTSVVAQRLFYKSGCCVEAVFVGNDSVQFTLHIPSNWKVRAQFELLAPTSGRRWRWESPSWSSTILNLALRDLEPGTMELRIEDCLAYVSQVRPAEVPF